MCAAPSNQNSERWVALETSTNLRLAAVEGLVQELIKKSDARDVEIQELKVNYRISELILASISEMKADLRSDRERLDSMIKLQDAKLEELAEKKLDKTAPKKWMDNGQSLIKFVLALLSALAAFGYWNYTH